jgi:hypothetical protein
MKMSKVYPQITQPVVTNKIDRRQGSEFDIVIVDLTRTQGAGFMKDKKRLNVLFSRAKNGLYVVDHKKCIDDLNRSNGKFLQKFQSEYLRFCRHLTAPVDCHWYQPEQIDDYQEGDDEPLLPDIEEEPEDEDLESQIRRRLVIYTGLRARFVEQAARVNAEPEEKDPDEPGHWPETTELTTNQEGGIAWGAETAPEVNW